MSYKDFKIGARVKFIAADRVGHADARQGDTGKITAMDDVTVQSDTLVTVMTDRGVQIRVNPHRLEVLYFTVARSISIPSDAYAGFVPGAKVRMINEDPRWGRGPVKVGDIGTLVRAKEGATNGWFVKFKNHSAWSGLAIKDLELVETPVLELPSATLDEAVTQAKLVMEEIKALEAKLAGYKQVMTAAGVKLI